MMMTPWIYGFPVDDVWFKMLIFLSYLHFSYMLLKRFMTDRTHDLVNHVYLLDAGHGLIMIPRLKVIASVDHLQ